MGVRPWSPFTRGGLVQDLVLKASREPAPWVRAFYLRLCWKIGRTFRVSGPSVRRERGRAVYIQCEGGTRPKGQPRRTGMPRAQEPVD